MLITNLSTTPSYYLKYNTAELNKTMARISSGNRFANPGENVGVSVASSIKSTVNKLGSVLDGLKSLKDFQTSANTYMQTVQDNLDKLKDLADKSTSTAYTDVERVGFDAEFQKILTDTRTLITNAQFNGQAVISGGAAKAQNLGGSTSVSITPVNNTTDLAGIIGNITTSALATTARTQLDAAQALFNTSRGTVLADLSILDGYINGITVEQTSKQTQYNNLVQIDVAEENTKLARQNILVQASTKLLSDANNITQQTVLSLLA